MYLFAICMYEEVSLLTFVCTDMLKFNKQMTKYTMCTITTAGSDGVKLCHSMEEAKSHFNHLLTVEAVNGGYNTQVLCQEFLRGKEYVVDHVSRKYLGTFLCCVTCSS